MKIAFTPSQEQFRNEAAGWLHEQLTGAFADLHGMSSHTQAVSRRRLWEAQLAKARLSSCLLYTSPSPRDGLLSRMPSSA